MCIRRGRHFAPRSLKNPLQIVGAIANHALLAQRAGYPSYLSFWRRRGSDSLGLPDTGISTLDDVLTSIRRITDVARCRCWWMRILALAPPPLMSRGR